MSQRRLQRRQRHPLARMLGVQMGEHAQRPCLARLRAANQPRLLLCGPLVCLQFRLKAEQLIAVPGGGFSHPHRQRGEFTLSLQQRRRQLPVVLFQPLQLCLQRAQPLMSPTADRAHLPARCTCVEESGGQVTREQRQDRQDESGQPCRNNIRRRTQQGFH